MPPASGPISMAELESRLERAAQAETFGLNELELLAAREERDRLLRQAGGDQLRDPALFGPALSDVKRQAMALAMAAQIAKALRARPELALGLGIPTETAVS